MGATRQGQGTSVQGMVERVTFHCDETGFAVLRVRVAGRRLPVTVVGTVVRVTSGERIEGRGEWREDERYGEQFVASELRSLPPDSVEGLERFLGSGMIDGVGAALAKRIVAHFGADVVRVLDQESALLEQVEGIGPKRRREIKASWERQKAVRGIMIFLHEQGVPTGRAITIYDTYGDDSLRVLREAPYRLADEIRGVGFPTADLIARKMGLAEGAPERLRAGLLYGAEQLAREGHSAPPRAEVLGWAAGKLAVDGGPLEGELRQLVAEGRLVEGAVGGEVRLGLAELWADEGLIAGAVERLGGLAASYPAIDPEKALAWVEGQTGKVLTAGQEQAVREALARRLLVVTGGPGVGKTTVLDSLLRILLAKGVRVVLAAPTGRAARRLEESTGQPAQTMHRLLGLGGGTRRRPEGDLFVIDEASMVDVSLMASLVRALPEGANLLLVGDVDQLPAVGPGRVLGDLIDSGRVAVVRLDEVQRQAAGSRIIMAAHAVQRGEVPELGVAEAGSDFYFVERGESDDVASTVVRLVKERIPAAFGLDPSRDVQVLTPMNRGPLGVEELNRRLQGALNPGNEFRGEIDRGGCTYREGDKVIQMRNDYERDVFNGDIGVVVGIGQEPTGLRVRFEGGRTASYGQAELDDLRLAYAITVHKSQGSEFPVVVMPVSTQHFVLLKRKLLYTGLTRGRRLVVLVGQRRALELAVADAGAGARWTGLCGRLAEVAPGGNDRSEG